jgi:hypothetical protein
MILTTLTIIHVALSLAGILAGFVVVLGLLNRQVHAGWTAAFLIATVATSVTGFLFPFHHFLPSHGVGIVSLLVLCLAIWALYGRHLEGGWRRTYAISAVLALYLNVLVLIVQLFLKVPALQALAPTQTEPPFKLAQLVAAALFVVVGIAATVRFGRATAPPA